MAVAIRLSRGGAKKRPYYKIVVTDSRTGRDGKFIERIGSYNPMLPKDSPERVKLDADRARHWLSVGAQPSDRVARFLDAAGVRERAARQNLKKGEPGEKAKERAEERAGREAEAAEAAAAEAAAAEAAAGDVVADTDPATAGPDAASFAGEGAANAETEAVSVDEGEGVTVVGDSEEPPAPPARPVPAYREGMPTDAQGVEEALEHEEERTGEDGEMTTRTDDGADEGAPA